MLARVPVSHSVCCGEWVEGSVFKSPLVWGEVGCTVPSTGDDCLDRSATVSDYFRWRSWIQFAGCLLYVTLVCGRVRMLSFDGS